MFILSYVLQQNKSPSINSGLKAIYTHLSTILVAGFSTNVYKIYWLPGFKGPVPPPLLIRRYLI